MRKIVFLTYKPYDDYFRKYLIKEMIQSGHYEVLYVCLREEISLFLNEKPICSFTANTKNYFKTIRRIKDFQEDQPLIIWNALIFCFWKFYLLMRFHLPRAFVVYDVFDYFYYYEKNLFRLSQFKIIDGLYQISANKIITLSRRLTDIYKKAYWLNNASHLRKNTSNTVHKRIGVISSIEYRIDFALLEKIAKNLPEIEIALYGWIKSNNQEIRQRLDSLIKGIPNIKYYGEYKNDELENILSTIDIGLVPYVTNLPLMKYINPDKYFHYLCYGIETISTPIDAANELNPWVHICHTCDDFVRTINEIYSGNNLLNKGDFWEENSWDNRLKEIETHVLKHY